VLARAFGAVASRCATATTTTPSRPDDDLRPRRRPPAPDDDLPPRRPPYTCTRARARAPRVASEGESSGSRRTSGTMLSERRALTPPQRARQVRPRERFESQAESASRGSAVRAHTIARLRSSTASRWATWCRCRIERWRPGRPRGCQAGGRSAQFGEPVGEFVPGTRDCVGRITARRRDDARVWRPTRRMRPRSAPGGSTPTRSRPA